MKKIANLSTNFIIFFLLVSCGTSDFLGFEEKKVKLEGKRVALLQQTTNKIIDEEVLTKIILSNSESIFSWDQSYNSPSHLAINFEAVTTFSKSKRISLHYTQSHTAFSLLLIRTPCRHFGHDGIPF